MIMEGTLKKTKENRFKVIWEIDIDGGPRTEREAAEEALEIMRDPGSIATVFKVYKNKSKKCKLIDLANLIDSCDECRKCGTSLCGNDTKFMRCWEPK